MDLTKKEHEWLKEVDKLFKKKPKNFMLYSCDSDIVVCKKGCPCEDISWSIKNSNINCCCVIRDVHDDMGFGL